MSPRKRVFPVLVALWLITSLLAACTPSPTPPPTPTVTPSPTPLPLDAWVEEGGELLKQSDLAGAEEAFKRVIEADRDYGPAYVGLTQIYYWQTGLEDEALAQARKAVEVSPGSAEAYAVLALAYEDLDVPAEAVEAAEQAVGLDENSAFVQAALAKACLLDRQYEEAQQAAERAVELDSELAEAYHSLAMFYQATADFPRARAALEQAIALEPAFVGWHVSLGYFWAMSQRHEEAIACFDRALALVPDFVPAVLGMVGVHRDRREYEEAKAQIERAVELAPDAPAVYVSWGYLCLEQEEYDEALTQFRKALEKREGDWYAQSGIGTTYLQQEECDSAARQFQDLIAAQPRFADGQIGLGYARLCEQDVNKALETFRKALDVEPYNSWAQAGLGYAYSWQGRWEEATAAYVEALRLSAAKASTHNYLGYVLWTEEEIDAAKTEHEVALTQDPDSVEAHVGLSEVLLQDGEASEAQTHAEHAVSLEDTNERAKLTLGSALVMQGEAEEAVQVLEEVVEEEPENPLARFYLGLAYRDLGEYSKAQKELETLLALSPEDDPSLQRVSYLIEALNQGYTLTEEKAVSNMEEMLEEIEPDISVEDVEEEGRTFVVSIDIPPGQEQQEMGMLLGAIAGLSSLTVPRIDPPIEDGLLIRLEEWGRPKFTVQVGLDDMRSYADGVSSVMDFIGSMHFSRLVADERASVREIQSDASEVRELDPETTVPYHSMTQEELHEYLTESADDEYREEMRTSDALLTMLGVIEPDLDLEELMIDLYTEQVAGFYDTDEDTFYVLEDEEQTASDQMTIAHEYVHALQDQHFDLGALEDENLNADQRRAFGALVEGDATLAMLLYAEEYISLFDQLESISSAGGLESEVFDASPSFIQEMELFPYAEGYDFVGVLYDRGGWEAVNEAYENPPQSTEQILHAERYRQGDEPREVSLPDLAGELGGDWEVVESDVLGELGLRLALAEYVGPATASLAAEGWGGDRYALLQQGADGPYALVMQTYWDDQDEADEFWRLYQLYMAHRLDYTEKVENLVGEVQDRLWLSEGSGILASRGERYVTIVLGPDEETVEQILEVLSQ